MNVLEVHALSKKYGNSAALDAISFAVGQGQIVGFLGPNGAGKSTTIKIIMDFLHASSGRVLVFGKDSHWSAVALKQLVGYVPAETVLYGDWTVDEHLQFTAEIRGGNFLQKAYHLLRVLELDRSKKIHELSTGNQQKLAIILAISAEPQLLILDEPTRGLDPLLRATFHDLLREYRATGGTILLSSHDLGEVEALCDKVLIIHHGRIIKDTTIDSLRSKHSHKVTVHFTGEVPPKLAAVHGVSNLIVTKSVASFTVSGAVQPTLDMLAKQKVEDVEITSASLEDIFRELYT